MWLCVTQNTFIYLGYIWETNMSLVIIQKIYPAPYTLYKHIYKKEDILYRTPNDHTVIPIFITFGRCKLSALHTWEDLNLCPRRYGSANWRLPTSIILTWSGTCITSINTARVYMYLIAIYMSYISNNILYYWIESSIL